MILKGRRADLTEGRILPKLLLFTLPIIATNLLQILYNAADMIIVSLSSEPNAVGAVGATSPFVAMITNIFIGFSVGANVTIAKYIGASDRDRASRATHTAIILSVLLGILAGTVGFATSRLVLGWMGAPESIIDLSTLYTRTYFVGIPFISLTNTLAAVCRARGDSSTPLVVLSLSGLVNVGLNCLMVLGFGMSVEGVAIATVAANLLSALILWVKLRRSEDEYTALSPSKLRIDRSLLREIVHIGLPSAVQGAFISLSNMIMTSSLCEVDAILTPDPKYSPVLNGNSAQNNLDSFVYTSTNAVYQGVVTFTGQNHGAKNYRRVLRGLLSGMLLSALIGAFISGVILLFHEPLLSLYGIVPGEPGSIAAISLEVATKRAAIVTSMYFLCGLMDSCNGALRGMGRSITTFVLSFFGMCVLRVFWNLVIFPLDKTVETVYVGFPMSWLITFIVSFTICITVLRREMARERCTKK